MSKRFSVIVGVMVALGTVLAVLAGHAGAAIQGLSGSTTFNFTAATGYIATGEGNSVFIWGYGETGAPPQYPQYPGPTIIVNEGDPVVITLTNNLSVPTSIVFPGQIGVTATGGSPGLITREAAPGGVNTVTYSFIAANPGTYIYHSGTRSDLQVDMGLFGALIVRPAGFVAATPRAYGHIDTSYTDEYLFLLSEMDYRWHLLAENGLMNDIDTSDHKPVYWFVNGRTFPHTIDDPGALWLPNQPYSAFPMMHPGEKLLLRIAGASKDLHPFHTHGNNVLVIARNGRVLSSTPDIVLPDFPAPDIARSEYTVTSVPGQTADGIFEWTATGLGWDIYGTGQGYAHNCAPDPAVCTDNDGNGFDDTVLTQACYDATSKEYCPDHGKTFPVTLPSQQGVTFGEAFSGSPFLGDMGALPTGHVSINQIGALMFPWHSHHEKEIVNNDVFIGGMISVLYIVPQSFTIPFR